MTSLRLGVLGGSFDPIHYGHLVAASDVADHLGLDAVIFSPAGDARHKETPGGASAADRYRLVVAATAPDPRFRTTRVDIDRPGPTYTVDTLADLRAQFAADQPDDEAEWFFITGADALADVPRWHDPAGILAAAHLVGVTRPGHELADPGLPADAFTVLQIPGLDISSTELRERVRSGRRIDYLCPATVVALVFELGLYRS